MMLSAGKRAAVEVVKIEYYITVRMRGTEQRPMGAICGVSRNEPIRFMERLEPASGVGRIWMRRAMAVFALLVLAACGGETDETADAKADRAGGEMTPADPGGPGGPGFGETQPPAGAIPMGDETYMVPIGRDPGGCQQFTMWSATKPVAQVIYYRARKGGFTADRGEADCGNP